MKKVIPIFICILLGIMLYFLCFDYNKNNSPKELFNVYLEGKYLGVIENKKELEEYIDKKTNHLVNIKDITKTYCDKNLDSVIEQEDVKKLIESSKEVKKYKKDKKDCIDIILENGEPIDRIYSPNGLKIEKIMTYKKETNTISEIYEKIMNLKSFTVEGYQFTINKDKGSKYIYVLEKDSFADAVNELIKTYTGEEEYEAYIQDNQLKIETTGSLLENVYIEENITVKKMKISMDQEIYTSYKDLATFLLYGNSNNTKTYKVKEGQMISDIAYENKISNQEFLISNPKYKNETSLIKAGTEVLIKETNPQLNVVVEKFIVEDKINDYKVLYQYDDDQFLGYEKVTQEGENGLERVSSKQKIVNGNIAYVQPISKKSLKPTIDKIVIKGDKIVPNVGDLSNWGWPSESGWVISSDYSWRILEGKRNFHHGIDIAGTGYNSDVYAANNGTIENKEYRSDFGNMIVINHNNGYYTVYAHLNKFAKNLKVGDTVSRGQLIGLVGSTGYSFGPHIHFEVWKDCRYCRINPWTIYR